MIFEVYDFDNCGVACSTHFENIENTKDFVYENTGRSINLINKESLEKFNRKELNHFKSNIDFYRLVNDIDDKNIFSE